MRNGITAAGALFLIIGAVAFLTGLVGVWHVQTSAGQTGMLLDALFSRVNSENLYRIYQAETVIGAALALVGMLVSKLGLQLTFTPPPALRKEEWVVYFLCALGLVLLAVLAYLLYHFRITGMV